ncbi:energy-coupling factor ABC transporter substrate-binding protein [Brevibacillus dissolubilis]|uniref:energy-coupling factor ABC transporter substrate-binding protein n=1 Tax=Brevibacillus dissolubilis TaxID=1844116 RepID=UPI00111794BA|nr:energy-coupling factor ABC transporter substrate-binding protein [Brevibacillus dissolubilis]
MTRASKWINICLLLAVVVITVLPLILVKDSEFGGSDGTAQEAIGELAPGYQAWFEPLLEPPGGETESLLFAVQAAIGAGVIGYAIGFYKGRSHKEAQQQDQLHQPHPQANRSIE